MEYCNRLRTNMYQTGELVAVQINFSHEMLKQAYSLWIVGAGESERSLQHLTSSQGVYPPRPTKHFPKFWFEIYIKLLISALFTAPDSAQFNWTKPVELNQIRRCDHSYNSTQLIPTGTGEFCKFWTFCCCSSWAELSSRKDLIARFDKTERNLVAASCDPVDYFATCVIGHSIVYAEVLLNYNL